MPDPTDWLMRFPSPSYVNWLLLFLPVGFALLVLQGLSELIKRVAFVAGKGPDPIIRHDPIEAEKQLVEELRRMAEEKA